MKLFIRDQPRAIALATDTHVLIFRHSSTSTASRNVSTVSVSEGGAPRCVVEFAPWEGQDMGDYRSLSSLRCQGTLGLVTLDNDVFLCVVNGNSTVATIRPGETIQRILSVEFHCLNRGDYDHLLNDQVNPFPTDNLDADGRDYSGHREQPLEHPCLALKKLLSGGSFYYSADFDLTKRLQDRPAEATTVAIDSLDDGFLWNTYMIQPLVDFRSRLAEREKDALDQSKILTSAIRGFAATVTVPASSSPARSKTSGFPSNMTLISRLSCRRAGTRFNARGIDDDGNVANFVETETLFCTDTICFSYVQCRGSVPIFWEQASGLPGQQKIQITRSAQATQPAFDKHFDALEKVYGDVFVVNLLSEEKPSETQITRQYEYHINKSELNRRVVGDVNDPNTVNHEHLKSTNYDFHAQTRGPNGYEAASGIKGIIRQPATAFGYFLSEETREVAQKDGRQQSFSGQNAVLEQTGIFRTNCLDCLDRTNLVQTIISQLAIEILLLQRGERSPTSDFWARHGTLWADCGDALSKIYAGTGALKSSFTRSGKMSFAGALADVRKSAQRLYINNFEDKGRQNTIDMLLGRLLGQLPVHLYDPINDWVSAELNRRAAEYSSAEQINIFVGTFNLNGRTNGIDDDLSCWLCPELDASLCVPEIVAIAFQEIVELSVEQIMATDPNRRQAWEDAVRKTLNANARRHGSDDYVMLRGGQLVGASLSVFVKASALPYVKNVEGAVKKTGMSGMAGNKGAVAIRMEYADTSICLVTAHLAAGFANYEERNQDYRTISNGLRFLRNRSIEDHDTIIWFGDFNYRIGMDNERARKLIKQGDLGTLYENDQLNLQMVHGKTFPFYTEKTPTFLPTYKYNLGTDDYDTSDKARIPAWCDRIVTRGDNLRQLYYDTAPLRFSDHRPVWGLFQCTVCVVHPAEKERISVELYARRRAAVGNHATSASRPDSDDEDLYGYDSIAPGLPPASSDRRKWWLDNGMPARSTVRPPGPGYVPNAARSSNPFVPGGEPDWVRVDKPATPPPRRTGSRIADSSLSGGSRARGDSAAPAPGRQLPPAPPPARQQQQQQQRQAEEVAPQKPPRPASMAEMPTAVTARTEADGKVHLKSTLRKAVPPDKPEKPRLLRLGSQQSSVSVSSTRSMAPPPPPEARRTGATAPGMTSSSLSSSSAAASSSSLPAGGPMEVSALKKRAPETAARAPLPPPRSRAEGKPGSGLDASGRGPAQPPLLPPRRGTGGLMDEDVEPAVQGWRALKPG